jgi:cell division protein FtsB
MSQSTAAVRVPTRPLVRPVSRERLQPPRLRVVAPAPRRTAGGLALLSVGLLGIGLLVLLLLNISIGKGAYALTELQRQQRQLAQDRQALAEQVQAASAPQKLAARARRLGMVPAPNTVFVRLPDGTLEGKPMIAQAPPKPVPKGRTRVAGATAKMTSGTKAGMTGGTKAASSP